MHEMVFLWLFYAEKNINPVVKAATGYLINSFTLSFGRNNYENNTNNRTGSNYSVIVLSSCSPVVPPTETPTLTPSSTYSPVLEPTGTPPSPTALPTQPESTYAVITSEPAELERWQEYEEALGNAIYKRVLREDIICEWLIVGRVEREVYVWAACSGIRPYDSKLTTCSRYGVVYLGVEGEVLIAMTGENIPGSPAESRRILFPPGIYERCVHTSSDKMWEHLESRRENPEPPLIVLNATPTP